MREEGCKKEVQSMKRMAIVTLAVALEGEKGYSRFRFLANLLSNYYEVDLITSTFQHWEKKQRQSHVVENMKSKIGRASCRERVF